MKGYQELNDVVVASNLGAGAKAWSGWLEGYSWGRKLIVRVSASQPFDVVVQRRGTDASLGQEILANSVTDVPVGGARNETDYDFATGRSFRVAVRNNGDSMTDVKVSLVLIG